MSDTKVYLGDGLYADFDGNMVILTAEDGTKITNVGYLEPAVLAALLRTLALWGLTQKEDAHE
jgi:hypothetical protein